MASRLFMHTVFAYRKIFTWTWPAYYSEHVSELSKSNLRRFKIPLIHHFKLWHVDGKGPWRRNWLIDWFGNRGLSGNKCILGYLGEIVIAQSCETRWKHKMDAKWIWISNMDLARPEWFTLHVPVSVSWPNLTTKIITLWEFLNFVHEVSRLQYHEWSRSDCWCIWKSLGVNACLQWRNVFSCHWRSVFVQFIFDCTCALADQSWNAGMLQLAETKSTQFNRGISIVFLLGIFRRAPCPSDTRWRPCALLLPRERPAP
jgi:hypothetical protein